MSGIFKELSQPCPLCKKGTLRPTEGHIRPDDHIVIERVCDNCGHTRPKVIIDDRPRVEPLTGFKRPRVRPTK
ncbi:hypothetical protein ES703_06910 [subsurface metagenome]